MIGHTSWPNHNLGCHSTVPD